MKITLLNGSPEQVAVAGALGCNDVRSSAVILDELQGMPPDQVSDRCRSVLANSFDRGHGAVGDQANFTFSLEGVSRLTTLFFCQSAHSSYLQQSMRRVTAENYLIPEGLRSQKFAVADSFNRAFEFYNEMIDAGIPAEDARYILPLGTTTNIQINTNARELCHYQVMANSSHVPLEIHDILYEMYPMGEDLEPLSYYPAPDLFADSGPIDATSFPRGLISYSSPWLGYMFYREDPATALGDRMRLAIERRDTTFLSFLKHFHFTFCFELSLAALHQLIRQRTWDVTVETLKSAASSGIIRIPPSIKSRAELEREFKGIAALMLNTYFELADLCCLTDCSSAFYLLPHALMVRAIVHINGWNAVHAIGKRTCSKAQWEIREIAGHVAQSIKKRCPSLGEYCGPQCEILGRCPEQKPCGRLEKE